MTVAIKSRQVLPNGDVVIDFGRYRQLIGPPARKWSPNWWIYEHGYYEQGVTRAVQRLVQPGDAVVDVGANIGYYALMMASLVGPAGRVIAFEPHAPASRYLVESLKLNGYTNVQLLRVCLGSRNGRIYFDPKTLRGRCASSEDGSELTVEVRRFDDLVDELGLVDRISLVKVDVEGGEMDVVRGMYATLLTQRPHLLIEIHPGMLREQGEDPQELTHMLTESGYSLEPLDSWGVKLDGSRNCHVHACPCS